MVCTYADASCRLLLVPASSQANPRLNLCTRNWPRRIYAMFTSVISNSPRADGRRFRVVSTTWLSYKYNPGTA